MRDRLLMFFCLLTLPILGQGVELGVHLGTGSYRLDELRAMQDAIDFPGAEAVVHFPPTLNYKLSLGYNFNEKGILSSSFTFFNSGARTHLLDYSAEYKYDFQIKAAKFSLGYEHHIYSFVEKRVKLYSGLHAGLLYTEGSLREEVDFGYIGITWIRGRDLHRFNKYQYTSYFVEPSVLARYQLNKSFSLEFNVSYELDIETENGARFTEFNYSETLPAYVVTDWSGIRVFLGVKYSFGGN